MNKIVYAPSNGNMLPTGNPRERQAMLAAIEQRYQGGELSLAERHEMLTSPYSNLHQEAAAYASHCDFMGTTC